MSTIFKALATFTLVLITVGCSDESGYKFSTDTNEVIDQDTGTDPGDTTEQCIPTQKCDANTCGSIDDGCGNTIQCTPCDCTDGTTPGEPCGGCDLGLTHCSPDGVSSCAIPTIPDWAPQTCDGLVFVSPNGSPTGTGSKEDPVNSIKKGLELASTANAKALIIAGTQTDKYEGPVHLTKPISIIGGYTVDGFIKDTTHRPVIESTLEGLSIVDVPGKILIERIEIRTADATTPGEHTYGIRVVNSPAVTIRHVQAVAGKGAPGASGAHGSNGANGGAGGDADIANGWDDQAAAEKNPGLGGKNASCPTAAGGDGGKGKLWDQSGITPAKAGVSVPGATGGTPGVEVENKRAGGPGASGEPVGTVGNAGIGGRAAGEIIDGFWVATAGTGETGESGENGGGGAGGGGGSGCAARTTSGECVNPPASGALGGGGAAGGCGGHGGTGGKPGGWSFGLLVVDSDIQIEQSAFFSSNGGDGGKAGNGGNGGSGGKGGLASIKYEDYDQNQDLFYVNFTAPFLGGKGGDGGNGSAGGNGGGGAGGSSYAAYCVRSGITETGTVRYVAATGGDGGAGGVKGENGLSSESFQCK